MTRFDGASDVEDLIPLRKYDEAAKRVGDDLRPLAGFLPMVQTHLEQQARGPH